MTTCPHVSHDSFTLCEDERQRRASVTRNDIAYARQFLHGAIESLEDAHDAVAAGNLATAAHFANRATIYAKEADERILAALREAQEAARRAEG